MSHSPWFHRQPTLLPGRPVRPDRLYLARSGASGFFMSVAFALYALYVVRDAGLTPVQLITLAVTLELTCFAFEIPTGVLADAVSRRLSIIAGTVLSGVAWTVMGLFPSYEGILAGQFLWGVAATFMSGATEAWVADEVGEDAAARLYPRAAQWRQAAMVAGVIAGAGLGLLDTSAPFLAGGLGHALLGVVFLSTMTEEHWRPTPRAGSALAAARRIAVDGLGEARRRPVVRAALAVRLLFGASCEMFESLWSYYLVTEVGLPGGVDEAAVFGGMAVAAQVGALALVGVARRTTADGSRASAARALSGVYFGSLVAALAFAFAPAAGIAVVLAVLTRATMGAEWPFFTAWVNRGLDPTTRATVLSTLGQADSLGQAAQGPLSASLVGFASVRAALTVGGLLVAPAAMFVRTRPHEERGGRGAAEREAAEV